MRTPSTRPNWKGGKFAVLVGDEHQGYFRTFTGAWHWRNYLATTAPAGTMLAVTEHGQVVNVRTAGEAVTVDPKTGSLR